LPTNHPPAAADRHVSGCLEPVLVRGRVDHIDGATGELLHRYTTVHEPGGVLRIACKTRRASRCTPCAEVYRADTYQLIRAGLTGGKGVPLSVAEHPCVFATLTAPSLGPVHARRERGDRILACRPRRRSVICPHGRPISCPEHHAKGDDRLGEPLCFDCYDYTSAVLFNACAPELWRRLTIALRRALAREAGLTNKALAAQLRVSYAKVAEYQRRGVVHFHAVIRLDGLAGLAMPPPPWANVSLLDAAIRLAARTVQLPTPSAPGVSAATVRWGREIDVRHVTMTGDLTDTKVAAYVAKYATKAAECTGTIDRRITPGDRLTDLPIREHARRHIAECLRLGAIPDFAALRLTAWAHMLGFSGHFSTKSRTYSTTLSALRADRATHQREQAQASGLLPGPAGATTLVVTSWHFAGRGHPAVSFPFGPRPEQEATAVA
jgi:hypothetical protein